MHISNSYSLQRKMETKKGIYDRLHTFGMFLKILFLLSIFGILLSLWMLCLTAALLAGDIVLSIYRSKTMFTYVYLAEDGVFYVKKIGLDGKETVLEQVDPEDITSCRFVEKPEGKKYYAEYDDFGEDKPMEIVTKDKTFNVLADTYLYSIIKYGMKEKK